jgi:hypothetical protein
MNGGACLGAGGWDGGEQDVPGYVTANDNLLLRLLGVQEVEGTGDDDRQTTKQSIAGQSAEEVRVCWDRRAQARHSREKPLLRTGRRYTHWYGKNRRREGEVAWVTPNNAPLARLCNFHLPHLGISRPEVSASSDHLVQRR